VGKTSIGRSVAEALGREYVRISLVVCAMSLKLEDIENVYRCDAGRIIQSLKKRLEIIQYLF
jgi:ATP-dependent Lon protease